MTTPRIKEMAKDWLFAGDEPKKEDEAVYKEFIVFLTQAHQSWTDEVVEDKRKLLEDFADFAHTRYLGTDGKEYAYSQEVIYMVEDYLTIKALQDNK